MRRQHITLTDRSYTVLAAVESLGGNRLMRVYRQRTKKDYTDFMQTLAESYPKAVKIRAF